jgi:putative phosphoesterase
MLLGLLSDTHDRTDAMAAAVELLKGRGAQYFIHCGDVGSASVLDYLAGLPSAFVWGNCDWDRMGLQRYAEAIGVECYGAFGDLTLDGKRIAVMHGDDARLKQRILAEQQHDYLFQGHTHVPHDHRVGKTRVVNPGALHRANPRTFALLDLASDALTFLTLPQKTV